MVYAREQEKRRQLRDAEVEQFPLQFTEGEMDNDRLKGREFPVSAGILLGLGLGGFFDGIMLHQVLQWHHMLTSAGYPANSVHNLEVNTLWDGIFHMSTYIFVVLGLAILWRAARRTHIRWSGKLLVGTLLMGFGLFNVVEGIVDHQLLGIHHVNETVPRDQWIYWDIGFLVWGAMMLLGGWWFMRTGQQETPVSRLEAAARSR
jgi:uncharacterized membrane protein